jgi:tetratricopeptide (TPR) repeat protein
MKCDTIADLEGFLKIQEQALGANSDEVATTASKLAELYIQSNRLENAEVLLKRALRIRQNLQVINADCKKAIEECQSTLQKVVTMRSERLRPNAASTTMLNPVKVPAGMSHPGFSCSPTSDLLSSDYSRRSSDSRSQTQMRSPSSAPAYASGTVDGDRRTQSFPPSSTGEYRSQNNRVLLEAVHETELEVALMREMLGCDHPNIADMLRKLADLYCRLRMLGKMEPVLLESLRIREHVFGVDHLCVATELKNLAMLYLAQERCAAAEPLLKRAIAIRQNNLGRNHAKVADIEEVYASLLRKTNRFVQADSIDSHIGKVRAMTTSEAGAGALPHSFYDLG